MITYYVAGLPYSDELYHFGIKGQKWGVRRFENPDGTLTAAGKARYGTPVQRMAAKDAQRMSDAKAAYGEGAGTRRKLLEKEITQKRKTKEYSDAYEEASKNVDVAKSLKRAERLHKKSGEFVRGRDLADRGYTHSQNCLKTIGGMTTSVLTAAGGAYYMDKIFGARAAASIMLASGAVSAAGIARKGIKDAYSYEYYERNKKF